MRPRWRSLSGSVRNSPNRWVQNAPRVVQVFWPSSTQPPSTLRPRLVIAGQVAAGVGLGPALAPQVLGPCHAGQDVVLLLLRPEFEDGRRQQEDAVLRDPLRTAGPVVLLLEQQPLPQRRIATAVGLGPRHDRPPVLEQQPLPLEMCRESLGGVARRQTGRHVGLEPGAGLGPEGLFVVAPGQVHVASESDGPSDSVPTRAPPHPGSHAKRPLPIFVALAPIVGRRATKIRWGGVGRGVRRTGLSSPGDV